MQTTNFKKVLKVYNRTTEFFKLVKNLLSFETLVTLEKFYLTILARLIRSQYSANVKVRVTA